MVGILEEHPAALSLSDVVALSSALRTRQLASTTSNANLDDIPHLTRALSQVHADSARLLSARVAGSAPTPQVNAVHPAALRLFASVGFEADRLRRAVRSVENLVTFADAPAPTPATRRQPDWLAARALDDARLSMNLAFRSDAHAAMQADIAEANKTLVETLAARCDARAIDHARSFPTTPTTPRTPRTPRTPHTPRTDTRSSSIPADGRYLDAVRAIALDGDGPSAPSLMHETASTITDHPHFVESLAIVACVARHCQQGKSPGTDLTVWGARAVLEDQFAEHIGNLPVKPRLAAPAAVIPRIREYVQTLQREGRLGGGTRLGGDRIDRRQPVPLWPQVYFCMRIGHVEAALAILEQAEAAQSPDIANATHFFRLFVRGRKLIEKIYYRNRGGSAEQSTPTGEYNHPLAPGSLLGEDEYDSLDMEYRSVCWSSDDVYRRACFVLLSRLELLSTMSSVPGVRGVLTQPSQYPDRNPQERASLALSDADHSFLFGAVEDYMWFRLWLCRTASESQILSALHGFNFVSQTSIQNDIVGCGGPHFNPTGVQPLIYAFVLVAAGLYEEAVGYISSPANEQWTHYGVHLALVLYQLPWMKDEEAYPSLLHRYVSLFWQIYPAEAALYLMTIRKRDLLEQYLQDLLLTTGEYTLLLGSSSAGKHHPGALDELVSSATVPLTSSFDETHLLELRKRVSIQAAQKAETDCDFASAAQLYSLAGENMRCAEMVMKNLSEEVHKRTSPRRPMVLSEARSILRTADQSNVDDASARIFKSLEMLVKMSRVFDDVWMGRFGSAWSLMGEVGVLPLSAEDISSYRRDWSLGSDKLDSYIRGASVELLKVALQVAEYALETGNATRSANRTIRGVHVPSPRSRLEPRLPDCSEIRNLCTFAGVLGVSDREINAQLVRVGLLLT